MTETTIHPTAAIADGAELGVGVSIGPYTVVGPDVQIGDRTRVGPQVVVDGVTTIGADNQIVGQASLGTMPQDLSYNGEPTRLVIGDGNDIREFVTVNRGTVKGGGVTRVGNGCMLMACCHVAHDCEIEDRVILANNSLLAGHVHVQQGASISGSSAAHHFVTIGAYAYIGGMTRMSQDVPPFMLFEGHPGRVRKVNVVGLGRAGFGDEEIEALRQAFRLLYRSGNPRSKSLDLLRADTTQPEPVRLLVEAHDRIEKGVNGRYRESMREEFWRRGQALILGEGEGT